MATKKKLLQAAAGSAGGAAGALNVEDVFSTYLYEGNGSSQAIENDIKLSDAPVDNVYYHSSSSSVTTNKSPVGDFTVDSGGQVSLDSTDTKYASNSYAFDGTDFGYLQLNRPALSSSKPFCFEAWVYFNNVGTSSNMAMIASQYQSSGNGRMLFGGQDGDIVVRLNGGTVYLSTTTTVTASTWHHVAWSFDGTTHRLFFNGSLEDSSTSLLDLYTGVNTTLGGNPSSLLSGYNLNGNMEDIRITIGDARYTSSFTVPSAALPTDTADGLGEGGLVWIKDRTSSSNQHSLNDTERGATKYLKSNSTDAEATGDLTSFNSNGFFVKYYQTGYINESGNNIASWTFRKAPKFFDVVTYTGDGVAGREIAHNLGCEVGHIIVKNYGTTRSWINYHRTLGGQYFLELDNTGAAGGPVSSVWDSTDATSTHFTVGTNDSTNANGNTYVAYLFAHNDGDGEFGPTGDQDIIKCGSYSGTSSSGNFVDLGFEPQWVLIKNSTTSVGDWYIWDNMRGVPTGSGDREIEANDSAAEATSTGGGQNWIDFNATGFSLMDSYEGINQTGKTYIYIAIRRGPMAVPTDADDVFAIDFKTNYSTTSSGKSYQSGFPVDVSIERRDRSIGAYPANLLYSRLNSTYLRTNNTDAEGSIDTTYFDSNEGVYESGQTDTDDIAWMWRRAPSFCDVVAYTGNGTAGRTVSHNLGVAPEMMWVKRRNANSNWSVYHSAIGNDKYIVLNTTNTPVTSSTFWNNTDPSASSFTVGTANGTNNTNDTYIAYLFASLDGVSKVGSFTGNGTTINVDCGFSSGARFVMTKRTDVGSDWVVWDTERGIVAGNDGFLVLNDVNEESSSYDNIDPYSPGFSLNYDGVATNVSGASYIFYAIA
jgi:hypothetical protein